MNELYECPECGSDHGLPHLSLSDAVRRNQIEVLEISPGLRERLAADCEQAAAALSSIEVLLRSGDKLAAALEGMRPLPLVVDGLLAEWRAARTLAADIAERLPATPKQP